jgi:hypothetical protein
MFIGRAINLRERITIFCATYEPPRGTKRLAPHQILKPHHWEELQHLHDQLETFYEGTLMAEGQYTTLADNFQTLDWLLLEIELAKQKFSELYDETHRSEYQWLSECADQAWLKCEKYYKKVDSTAAYYAAVVLNPRLKMQWFKQQWNGHPDKKDWISLVEKAIRELWLMEYKCKSSRTLSPTTTPQALKRKVYTSARSHKRIRTDYEDYSITPEIDALDEYLSQNLLPFPQSDDEDDKFDLIQYWAERSTSNPELARYALDILAAPAMSDECERLFSSAKLLLTDRRTRLRMDIVEANECLRSWYGPPKKNAFDDREVRELEGELAILAEEEAEEDKELMEVVDLVDGNGEDEDEEIEVIEALDHSSSDDDVQVLSDSEDIYI